MKKFMFNRLLIAFAFISASAFAGSGWSTGKIKVLHFWEGHTGVLIKQEDMSDLGGCGRSDYYQLDKSHPFFKEIYSLLLAAHMSNQPIRIHLNGCVQGLSKVRHIYSVKS